ncbi:hypothetical protein K501DRAFT_338640 [Backusella circina FSU 941]|nr:hypothetical protein K501DRAFT_338640 [Backusella circina FSU 941]
MIKIRLYILLIFFFLFTFALAQQDDSGSDDSGGGDNNDDSNSSDSGNSEPTSAYAEPTETTASDATKPTQTDGVSFGDDTPTAGNSTASTPRNVSPEVCQALKQWYNSMNGNSWVIRTGWDSANMSSCCSWYSVHCNNIGQVLKV